MPKCLSDGTRAHQGWSSVYASSKSHVVVKFADVPKKDKAELKCQLSNEKIAYNKLSRITGWVVPRHSLASTVNTSGTADVHSFESFLLMRGDPFCILKSSHRCRS